MNKYKVNVDSSYIILDIGNQLIAAEALLLTMLQMPDAAKRQSEQQSGML